MNFLELCQAVVDEVGLSGQITTVVNQRGDFGRIVRFVRSSTQRIESKWIDWRFLRRTHRFETAEGIATYTAPESLNLRSWDRMKTYVDDLPVQVFHSDSFEYNEQPIEESYRGRPIRIIIEADNTLRFIGVPDEVYSVRADYFRNPTILTDNTQEPLIPLAFRRIIVAEAIRLYSNYDESPELKVQATEELYGVGGNWIRPEPGSLMHVLQGDQLPNSDVNARVEGGFFTVRVE